MIAACLAAAFSLLPGLTLTAPDISAVSPPEALEMIKAPGAYIVDVRTIAEYYLVGHPVAAINIPFTFWNERTQSFELNGNFVEDIRQRFKPSDLLIFICRSGGRSLRAAQEASQAGFAKVYHVNEGFEGDKDKNGYRTVGGWKNRDLPYTYEINPDLVYRFR